MIGRIAGKRAVRLVALLAMAIPIAKACAADAPPGSSTRTTHSCSPNYTDENKLGRLSVQQRGPGTSIQWGVYPSLPAERYKLTVYIGARIVDTKNQSYPPHGSLSPLIWNNRRTRQVPRYRTGEIFKITGSTFDSKGNVVQRFYIKCKLV